MMGKHNSPMRVIKVLPYGYCSGVTNALARSLEYAESHPDESIAMVGMLVHNEDAIRPFLDRGVKVLDERNGDLGDQLEKLEDGTTVIFSAHGHPRRYEEIARRKNMKVVDTTCRFVQENLERALCLGNEDLIYIGSNGHLECNAFLENAPWASFYDVKSNELVIRGKLSSPTLLAQTTLSSSEIDQAREQIKKLYPIPTATKLRCFATELRQDNLKKALHDNPIDCLIVLGSKTSNNSKKLFEIGEESGIDSYLCLNNSELKSLDLSKYSCLALSSGASTSKSTYEEALSYLESI